MRAYNVMDLRGYAEQIINLTQTVTSQETEIEDLRLKAAMYKAYFFQKRDLAERLCNQITENLNALTGEFDGFSYSSARAAAIYRTLEVMKVHGIISDDEYKFCIV